MAKQRIQIMASWEKTNWHMTEFIMDLYLVGSRTQFCSRGRRIIHVSDPDPCLAPNMLSGVHVRTLCWPVYDLYILLTQKSIGAMRYAGHGLVLDIHKVSSKNALCPGKHTIVEKPGVALVVESAIQHHNFTPVMVDSTPYHDWGAMVTVHCLDACIYRSLLLPAAHTAWPFCFYPYLHIL